MVWSLPGVFQKGRLFIGSKLSNELFENRVFKHSCSGQGYVNKELSSVKTYTAIQRLSCDKYLQGHIFVKAVKVNFYGIHWFLFEDLVVLAVLL